MWWNKKIEAPTSEPKFQLVDLRVQVGYGEHVNLKGTTWSVWNNGCLCVKNDTGGVAIFKRWDWIKVEEETVKT